MSEASDGTLGWRLEKSLPSGFGFQSATGSSAGRSPDRHNTELCNRGAHFPREPFPSEATATPGRQRRAPQQFQCTWPMQAEAMHLLPQSTPLAVIFPAGSVHGLPRRRKTGESRVRRLGRWGHPRPFGSCNLHLDKHM